MTNSRQRFSFFAAVLLLVVGTSQVLASRMYYHPGETQPITVEAAIGANFNITCYMNPHAFPRMNAKHMYFVNSRNEEKLPYENIAILNSSSIVYMVKNAQEQQTEYRCYCGSAAIMETKVFVGYPPKPATNFTCRSYDFDYMVCNFTKPSNPILTTYKVSYYHGMPSYLFEPHCNYDDRALVVCNISLKDRHQEYYNFIIEARNALVKENDSPLRQTIRVNNYDIMIPSQPGDNMRIDAVTVDSIRFAFQMPNWEKYKTKGLQWEVLIAPENSTVLEGDPPLREHNELHLRLTNLPYAYWRYELRLRVRVKNPQAVWSDQAVFPFRTAARRPSRPPRLTPGSFYIDSMETEVTLYWEELKPYEFSGDNFTYAIRSVHRNGHLTDLKPSRLERNLAIFAWDKYSRYDFEICSRNHIGDSDASSVLTIYPFAHELRKDYMPKDINNVYHANNRTYTLTWSKPHNNSGLLNYTVYWCYPKRALPNECRESMHFKLVPPHQLNFTTEKQSILEEHTLNLAVSANYETFNTGLHWTGCTMDVNGDLVKMEPDVVASVRSVKLLWSVERVCTSILDGFNLTFCEVGDNATNENSTCLEQPKTISLPKYDKKYNVTELKPFTQYKFSIYMYSRTKKGKPSDPLVIRTQEGAPSPPRQLKVFDITNTSASIQWMEPTQRNGRIRKYIIMLNNDKYEVNSTTLEYRLENLESFTSYKVYVLAKTIDTSETSNDVHFTTSIGYPSPPGQAPRSQNASVVQWSPPSKPRGRVEFYEVAITQKRNNEVLRQKISIIMGGETSCTFTKLPTCLGAEYQTTVEVRAVNAALMSHETSMEIVQNNHPYESFQSLNGDDNDDLACDESEKEPSDKISKYQRYLNGQVYQLYKSPWQTSTIYSCSNSRMSKITFIALVVVAMSLGVMAALYMARKKYNKMANIHCTLPAGLETYFTKDGTGFPGDTGASHIKAFDSVTRAAEDQWLSAVRIPEFNFRNEHHHLLASLGNDSGYLGGNNCAGSGSINGHTLMSSNLKISNDTESNDEQRDNDEQKAFETGADKACFGSEASSSVDSLVESTEESDQNNSDVESAPLSLFPSGNGYIKQSMLQGWQNFNDEADSRLPTNNMGYVAVQNLETMRPQPAMSSGYVLQQDLQTFFRNSINHQPPAAAPHDVSMASDNGGYTTLDELSKLQNTTGAAAATAETQQSLNTSTPYDQSLASDPSNMSSGMFAQTPNIKTNNTNNNINTSGTGNCISGYVTQQDLNLFAQHQQQF